VATENGQDESARYRIAPPDDDDYNRFQERLRKGRVKMCASCGGIMKKSSRMILTPLSGIALALTGTALMFLYGLATNFYHVSWYVRFVLPAAYYIGSLFVGIGILFFFIRERVWACPNCRESTKR
jgi:hypothetical protein